MIRNLEYSPQFQALLPETYELLKSADLTIHEFVISIILHGSRGLKDGAKPTSDIDLSLIVNEKFLATKDNKDVFLDNVIRTTIANWCSQIVLDLAVVFDIRHCGLKCFYQKVWDEKICSDGGIDCFGLYKIQKGFHGLVTNAGVEVKMIYPCLEIWHKK